MGIKTHGLGKFRACCVSEKPPHHMGIKTSHFRLYSTLKQTLKNLPTTWGLRPTLWLAMTAARRL